MRGSVVLKTLGAGVLVLGMVAVARAALAIAREGDRAWEAARDAMEQDG